MFCDSRWKVEGLRDQLGGTGIGEEEVPRSQGSRAQGAQDGGPGGKGARIRIEGGVRVQSPGG